MWIPFVLRLIYDYKLGTWRSSVLKIVLFYDNALRLAVQTHGDFLCWYHVCHERFLEVSCIRLGEYLTFETYHFIVLHYIASHYILHYNLIICFICVWILRDIWLFLFDEIRPTLCVYVTTSSFQSMRHIGTHNFLLILHLLYSFVVPMHF